MEKKSLVLDTNILISAFDRKDKEVQETIKNFYKNGYELAITSISAIEFLIGAKNFNKALDIINSFLVFDLDKNSWLLASKIGNNLTKMGEIPSFPDLLIASICILQGALLYTKNKKDFKRFEEFGLILV